jgi:hypothetical protein
MSIYSLKSKRFFRLPAGFPARLFFPQAGKLPGNAGAVI